MNLTNGVDTTDSGTLSILRALVNGDAHLTEEGAELLKKRVFDLIERQIMKDDFY